MLDGAAADVFHDLIELYVEPLPENPQAPMHRSHLVERAGASTQESRAEITAPFPGKTRDQEPIAG
jgi:hypothetical protein